MRASLPCRNAATGQMATAYLGVDIGRHGALCSTLAFESFAGRGRLRHQNPFQKIPSKKSKRLFNIDPGLTQYWLNNGLVSRRARQPAVQVGILSSELFLVRRICGDLYVVMAASLSVLRLSHICSLPYFFKNEGCNFEQNSPMI